MIPPYAKNSTSAEPKPLMSPGAKEWGHTKHFLQLGKINNVSLLYAVGAGIIMTYIILAIGVDCS